MQAFYLCHRPTTVTLSEWYSRAVLIDSPPSLLPVSPPSCSISHWPRFLLSLLCPSSHSLGSVWWTDVIIATSFMCPSLKEGGDCIHQALTCLRDAPGLCGTELAVWGKRGGSGWARLMCVSQAVNMWHSRRFNKRRQKHCVWTLHQNIVKTERGDDLKVWTSVKKKSEKTPD